MTGSTIPTPISGPTYTREQADRILELVTIPKEGLNLRTRTDYLLMAEEIDYIGDLLVRPNIRAHGFPGFGRISFNDVVAALAAHGLMLGHFHGIDIGRSGTRLGRAVSTADDVRAAYEAYFAVAGRIVEPGQETFKFVSAPSVAPSPAAPAPEKKDDPHAAAMRAACKRVCLIYIDDDEMRADMEIPVAPLKPYTIQLTHAAMSAMAASVYGRIQGKVREFVRCTSDANIKTLNEGKPLKPLKYASRPIGADPVEGIPNFNLSVSFWRESTPWAWDIPKQTLLEMLACEDVQEIAAKEIHAAVVTAAEKLFAPAPPPPAQG